MHEIRLRREDHRHGDCGDLRRDTPDLYRNFKDKYDLINWYFDKILLESFEHMGEGKLCMKDW